MQSTEVPDSMPWKQLAALAVTIFMHDDLDAPTKQRYHELFDRAKEDQSNGTVTLNDEERQLLGAQLSQEDLVWPTPRTPAMVQYYAEYTQRKGQSTEHGEGLMSLDQFAEIQVVGELFKTRRGAPLRTISDAHRETQLMLRQYPVEQLREDEGIPDNAKTGGEGVDMEQAARWIKEIRDMEGLMEDDDEDEEHEEEEEEYEDGEEDEEYGDYEDLLVHRLSNFHLPPSRR